MTSVAHDLRIIQKHLESLNSPAIERSPSFQILGFNGGSPLVEGVVYDIKDRILVPTEYERCKVAIMNTPNKHIVSEKMQEECALTLYHPESGKSLMATMGPDYIAQISNPDKFLMHLIEGMQIEPSKTRELKASFIGDDFRKLVEHAPVLMSTGYEPASRVLEEVLTNRKIEIIGKDTGSIYSDNREAQDFTRIAHMYGGKVTSCRLQNHYQEKTIGGVAILLTTPDDKVIMNLRDDIPNIAYPGHWSLLCGGIEESDLESEMNHFGQYTSPGIVAAKRELAEELLVKENGITKPYQPKSITTVDINTDSKTGNVRYIVQAEYDGKLDDLILMEGEKLGVFSPEQVQGMKVAKDYKQVVKDYFSKGNRFARVSGF